MPETRETQNAGPKLSQILLLLGIFMMGNVAMVQAFVLGVRALRSQKTFLKTEPMAIELRPALHPRAAK